MKDDGRVYEVDPVVSYGNGMYSHRYYANFHQGDGVSGGPDLRLAWCSVFVGVHTLSCFTLIKIISVWFKLSAKLLYI